MTQHEKTLRTELEHLRGAPDSKEAQCVQTAVSALEGLLAEMRAGPGETDWEAVARELARRWALDSEDEGVPHEAAQRGTQELLEELVTRFTRPRR